MRLETNMVDSFLRIINHQKRCVECGGTYGLETHHRIFRSKTEKELERFLKGKRTEYEVTHKKPLLTWGMHSVQNLVRLCSECHGAIHNGNAVLRRKYENSFTCPNTAFNVNFKKITSLY